MTSYILVTYSILVLISWAYLALFHGLFWKPLVETRYQNLKTWPSVRIIVPARNEAKALPHTLIHLLRQDYEGDWKIVLVDDHSTDDTKKVALDIAEKANLGHRIDVIQAPDLPAGWTGKVAALQAGIDHSDESDYVLFTDSDIAHPRTSLRRIVSSAVSGQYDGVSLMVRLHVGSVAEKLLIPAFVFFFGMLYPFRRVNDPLSPLSGGAGGTFLVRRKALCNAGGLIQIKSALIDDCALGTLLKKHGGESRTPGRIRLTLADDVLSLRQYPEIADVLRMISRTAFTQLRHSEFLLFLTFIGLVFLFSPPFLALMVSQFTAGLCLFLAFGLMTALYVPMVRFYKLPFYWALTLPLAAILYMKGTLDSALHYWQGKGGQWKGRNQAS